MFAKVFTSNWIVLDAMFCHLRNLLPMNSKYEIKTLLILVCQHENFRCQVSMNGAFYDRQIILFFSLLSGQMRRLNSWISLWIIHIKMGWRKLQIEELERASVCEHDNDLTSQNVGKLFATVVVGFNFWSCWRLEMRWDCNQQKTCEEVGLSLIGLGKKIFEKSNGKFSAKIENKIIEKVKSEKIFLIMSISMTIIS